MYTPDFELESFSFVDDGGRVEILRACVETLITANRLYLRARVAGGFKPARLLDPALGIRYEKEPPGRDAWQDMPRTFRLRKGDCEDLVAWRVAELRELDGELDAAPGFRKYELPGEVEYHVVVVRKGGRIEDVSRMLGMP